MADADARPPEPTDLFGVEMNAVREPCALRHPAGLLEQVDRAHFVHVEAEALLVLGFAEMRVQLAIVPFGEPRRIAHQPLVDRERRAGRERDADLRAGLGIVEELQHALAVGQDRLLVLHDGVGRQSAVLLAAIHRAARHRHADAERPRLFDLDVDGVLEAGREEIVMIGGRRAAREHQLGQREPHGEAQMPRLQPRPDRIERGQPGEQLPVDGRRDARGSASGRNDDAR